MFEVAMILGYGVMVTLQILVLSFLVRVRVSQLHLQVFLLKSKIGIWCNGNTTDSGPVILGSSPSIPTNEKVQQMIVAPFCVIRHFILIDYVAHIILLCF